jgi:hypothetical protein
MNAGIIAEPRKPNLQPGLSCSRSAGIDCLDARIITRRTDFGVLRATWNESLTDLKVFPLVAVRNAKHLLRSAIL